MLKMWSCMDPKEGQPPDYLPEVQNALLVEGQSECRYG